MSQARAQPGCRGHSPDLSGQCGLASSLLLDPALGLSLPDPRPLLSLSWEAWVLGQVRPPNNRWSLRPTHPPPGLLPAFPAARALLWPCPGPLSARPTPQPCSCRRLLCGLLLLWLSTGQRRLQHLLWSSARPSAVPPYNHTQVTPHRAPPKAQPEPKPLCQTSGIGSCQAARGQLTPEPAHLAPPAQPTPHVCVAEDWPR